MIAAINDIDAAGRCVDAMDLNDSDAQKLLNHAIEIEGNLFGKKNGQYYCFQRHLKTVTMDTKTMNWSYI